MTMTTSEAAAALRDNLRPPADTIWTPHHPLTRQMTPTRPIPTAPITTITHP